MDSNTIDRLIGFRNQLYGCFRKAGDAVFNIIDALLTETASHSLAELSLSAFCERRWCSIYQAIQQTDIDRQDLRRLFAKQAPQPTEGKRPVLGVDASPIARPSSRTAADRSYVHQSNLPRGCKPVTPGWQFSAVTLLPETPSSWTYMLDNTRVRSDQTQGEAAAEQIKEVAPLLQGRPITIGDGYYGSVTFLELVADAPCDFLLRLPKNRVLHRPAPPPTGRRGAPKKDGARFACKDPSTYGAPDEHWEGTNRDGLEVEVSVWHHLHFKKARDIKVSVIRIVRPNAKDTERDPRTSWFLFRGEQPPALSQVCDLYARRYSQEHGYRVDKQYLLWETPRLRTPEQFQHWTDMVACARNQLYLARPAAEEVRQPWESRRRELTPQQTRRAMPRILVELGTPARPPKRRGNSPGRKRGAIVTKATRYKVVYKASEKLATNV
jgi:hypothetical protein